MSKIKLVTCELTERCNLRCKHCYLSGCVDYSGGEELKTDQWKEIFSKLKEEGVEHIVLSGGEPMIRSDFFELVKECSRLGLICGVTTNGSFLNKKNISLIENAGISFIQVSIEGLESYHDFIRGKGDFNKVNKVLNSLTSKGIPFGTMTTITRRNYKDIEKLIEYLSFIGVKKISFEKYLSDKKNHFSKELELKPFQSKQVYQSIMKINSQEEISIGINDPLKCLVDSNFNFSFGGCFIGRFVCALDCLGNIKLCTKIPLKFGNIMDRKLKYLDRIPLVNKIVNRNFVGNCESCDDLAICGGCRAEAFFEGNLLGGNNSCFRDLC